MREDQTSMKNSSASFACFMMKSNDPLLSPFIPALDAGLQLKKTDVSASNSSSPSDITRQSKVIEGVSPELLFHQTVSAHNSVSILLWYQKK